MSSYSAYRERVELDEKPEKNDIWMEATANATEIVVSGDPTELEDKDRVCWYCPTVTIWDAHRLVKLAERHGIQRVADLGSGDCRLSLWLDDQGYDVVAYELNEDLVDGVRSRFGHDLELRRRDYYEDFDELVGPETAVVCFGGTNELPYVPDEGLAIEGYGEIGITAWYGGQEVAKW